MSTQWVFGYGSLLNLASVQETVPEVTQLTACYIKGFTRDFSYWSETGFILNNLDVGGIPFYALNVQENDDITKQVNGVIFEVDDAQFQKLALREHGYDLIQTVAYNYDTGEPLQDCIVYSAVSHQGEPFDVSSAAQLRYLQICLDGAATFGEDFYKQFLATTFTANKAIADIPELHN